MSLIDQIKGDLKQAMRDKDSARVSTLRLITAAVNDREIAMRAKESEVETTDQDIITILTKMTRQRQESIKLYEEGGRLELAEQERQEITIIQEFMPAQLSNDEIQVIVKDVINMIPNASMKDMGKIMGMAQSKLAGKADMGFVSKTVKEILSS